MKKVKKVKKEVRQGLVQSRVTMKEFQVFIEKAFLYTNGDVSKYVRMAGLNYKPLIKTKVGK